MEKRSAGTKICDWFRYILSCCDRDEEEAERPPLQISGPTNFRREEIRLPGLDEEQQRFLREKAQHDAQKLYAHLQPLRSSPSGHFASPSNAAANPTRQPANLLPSYEDFTTPRPPSGASPASPWGQGGRVMEGLKRHSRKLSNSLSNSVSKPLGSAGLGGGFLGGGEGLGREDSKYEMRALMEPSRSTSQAKLSHDSYGSSESERAAGRGAVGGVKF